MVLIPEERLLRYEERDKQRTENDLPEGIMYGGGEDWEETLEDSLSAEMIVRGIPNDEDKSPGITGTFKRKRRCYYVG